jgi:hypothetical protein
MALSIGSGHLLGMTLMDIVFTQQAMIKVGSIEKPHVLEFLRPTLTSSSIMEELKKYMNSFLWFQTFNSSDIQMSLV